VAATFRYITDAIIREGALEMPKVREATKKEREERVRNTGYPAYVTSAGWLGYDDDKIRRLTLKALHQGFNHFKVALFNLEKRNYRVLTSDR
jgi:L-fuconate dehydratase